MATLGRDFDILTPSLGDTRAGTQFRVEQAADEVAELIAGQPGVFTWDARPLLAMVRAPTLVLVGARDRANLPAARALAAGIPEATLELVPEAGHLWNATHAEQFDRILRTFLTSALRE